MSIDNIFTIWLKYLKIIRFILIMNDVITMKIQYLITFMRIKVIYNIFYYIGTITIRYYFITILIRLL